MTEKELKVNMSKQTNDDLHDLDINSILILVKRIIIISE